MKQKSTLYKILRPLIVFFTKVFLHPKFEGIENIPASGRVILAGTHKSIFDPFVLITSTKRQIHFLSKKEIFDGPFGFIFKNLGLIKVDRKKHSVDALTPSIEYLKNEEVIGIFPEGTFPKHNELLLPFKNGVSKMAYKSKSIIVPFVIKGKYGFRRKGLTIKFLKPINVKTDNYELETEKLRKIIITEMEK